LGYAPRYVSFLRGFELFTVSAASPRSHPKRLTPTGGQQVTVGLDFTDIRRPIKTTKVIHAKTSEQTKGEAEE